MNDQNENKIISKIPEAISQEQDSETPEQDSVTPELIESIPEFFRTDDLQKELGGKAAGDVVSLDDYRTARPSNFAPSPFDRTEEAGNQDAPEIITHVPGYEKETELRIVPNPPIDRIPTQEELEQGKY